KHTKVIDLLVKLSHSQVKLFLKDPYANAFNPEPNGACWHKDFPDQSPWVFERKFELDSWASILYLARKIKECYGRTDHLDDSFKQALELMINLAIIEQDHDRTSYVFSRAGSVPHDSLSHNGIGAPLGHTGMVYSAFRPSDDACVYGYLIPSNLFFMSELNKLSCYEFESRAAKLAADIEDGVQRHGIVEGKFAYEVDGLGNALCMDDANTPSLLSLPYLEVLSSENPVYQKTRSFVLSGGNPYFFKGSLAVGIGSQHTPKDFVWPIAIAIKALTSKDPVELTSALKLLEETDSGTGQMHESFHVDDSSRFTRNWFSWADMTYVDLVLESVGYSFE
ncbi:MAG: metal-independent alpha-mannosidase, partial [Actinobacteria bacterium]|nr:metal-independent alpha-mannosidase [Actinomycetota bacterium]